MKINVTWVSECDQEWAKDLTTHSGSLKDLKSLKDKWGSLCSDAFEIIDFMTENEFQLFREGLLSERLGTFQGGAWAVRYGPIIMPEILFKVSITAFQYHVPWGTAYIRMKEYDQL